MSQQNAIEIQGPAGHTLPAPALRMPRRLRLALVGPDGVGKSTVIALLRESFQRDFPGSNVEVRQWRPGLLPDLGRFIGKPATQGKAQKPRRHPGRFHMLRVFYYYWDFLLGSWWKDTVAADPGTLVIYDRCALDMQVDPVRFALRSTLGTPLLYRWTPKPEIVILLQDTPARILQRKQELEPHEMAEQLFRWRELAAEGQVHAIVRVNDGPEEIAARVSHLLRDALMPNLDATRDDRLAYIRHVLAGLPASYAGSATRELAVLPRRSAPRFLVPCSPRAAAVQSLDVYNPLTRMGRAWKHCIGAGFRSGLTRPMLHEKVTLPLGALERFLGDVAGCKDPIVSISLGTPGAHRKPVLQVMDGNGRVKAFAKVGWNDDTNKLVRNETAMLTELAGHTFTTAAVPRVLHAGWLGNNFVLVLAATAAPLRDGGSKLDERHLHFLKELHAIGACRRSASADSLQDAGAGLDSIRRGGFHYYAHLIECALERGAQRLLLVYPRGSDGMGHGDFAPWNIRDAGGKLLVLDWESGNRRTPPGWDLFHFLVQAALELDGACGAAVYGNLVGPTAARAWIEQYFGASAHSELVTSSLIAYLVDALSRSLIGDGSHPSAIDARARRAWAAMLALLLNVEGRAS